jgi:hypothetical protein
MTWSEDDFLERLIPHMRRQREHTKDTCPNTEVLLLLTDDSADPWLRKAYESHLERCPTCAELDRRLLRFAQSAVIDQPEWRATEKRLDNWMDGFLHSRRRESTANAGPETLKRRARWGDVWGPVLWEISVATGILALLVVAFIAYSNFEMVRRDKSSQTAKVAQSENASVAVEHNAESVPESVARTERRSAPRRPRATAIRTRNSQPLTVHKPGSPRSSELAKQANGTSTSPHEQSASAGNNDARGALPTKSPSPIFEERPAMTTAQASKGCAFCSVRPANTQTSHSASVPDVVGTISRQDTTPALRTRSLRLASGTRLWISVESTQPQRDGSMAFHGSLLLPLRDANSSNLEHGTEVAGSVIVEQTRSFLSLGEIIIKGTHYKLRGNDVGGGVAQAAGSGSAVRFDSGKVLELWLSSDSTYEAAANSGQ